MPAVLWAEYNSMAIEEIDNISEKEIESFEKDWEKIDAYEAEDIGLPDKPRTNTPEDEDRDTDEREQLAVAEQEVSGRQ